MQPSPPYVRKKEIPITDTPDGPLVGTVDIAHTGDWAKFMENKAALLPTAGRHDVYLVLTHPEKGGGLMNVDWVEFAP